jgi:hypothetical protein
VRSLKNLGRTCRFVSKAVRPLLYRNIEIRGYVPAARILETNWRWRYQVKYVYDATQTWGRAHKFIASVTDLPQGAQPKP